jgi:hypothetical protein
VELCEVKSLVSWQTVAGVKTEIRKSLADLKQEEIRISPGLYDAGEPGYEL